MTIKFTSGDIIGVPKNLISISGGWSAAPESGGIISFSGSAVFEGSSIAVPSTSFSISGVGTFHVTGTSTESLLGYSKTQVSITDKLGLITSNRSKSKLNSPLIYCIKDGKNVSDIFNVITNMLGISVSLPRSSSSITFEPLWAKENQDILSILNEILISCGCILYCKNNLIKCDTIKTFFSGLSGSSNDNTVASTFSVPNSINPDVGAIYISGTSQKKEKIPPGSTISKGSVKRSGRKITTTTINDGVKTITIEDYEAKPANSTNTNPQSINDCYPYDPGRITSRIEEVYYEGAKFEEEIFLPCKYDYYNSCNLDESKWPNTFLTTPGWTLVSITEETWNYNTVKPTISNTSNPQNMTPRETVKYTKTIKKVLALDNNSECNITFGNRFDFLEDEENALDFAITFDTRWKNATKMITTDKEDITWVKEPGSNRWIGERNVYKYSGKVRFKDRKTRVDTFRQKIDSGNLEIDDYGLFKTNFSLLELEPGENLVPINNEVREDWNPQFQTIPPEERVINNPWQRKIGTESPGRENLSLRAGRFVDDSTAAAVANEIKQARAQKKKSLAITNINEIFSVGEIDAPSFSIDVNGVKTSGVYLNG